MRELVVLFCFLLTLLPEEPWFKCQVGSRFFVKGDQCEDCNLKHTQPQIDTQIQANPLQSTRTHWCSRPRLMHRNATSKQNDGKADLLFVNGDMLVVLSVSSFYRLSRPSFVMFRHKFAVTDNLSSCSQSRVN